MNDRSSKASGFQVAGSSDNEQRRSILLDILLYESSDNPYLAESVVR
jgi:hypothetical protein